MKNVLVSATFSRTRAEKICLESLILFLEKYADMKIINSNNWGMHLHNGAYLRHNFGQNRQMLEHWRRTEKVEQTLDSPSYYAKCPSFQC